MFFLSILYYSITISAPIIVTYQNVDFNLDNNEYDAEKVCREGVGIIALLVYLTFAIISAFIELYMFIYVYKKVGYLLPNPIDIKDYD